jgi:hypothetical protein
MHIVQRCFDPAPRPGEGRPQRPERKLLDRAGEELRSAYGPLVQEPLPGQLTSILRRLDDGRPR